MISAQEKLHDFLLPPGVEEEVYEHADNDWDTVNRIRRHYLVHFALRNLDAIISDYADDAAVTNIVNGKPTSYRGKEEIRECFENIFLQHPTPGSTFKLEHVAVHDQLFLMDDGRLEQTQSQNYNFVIFKHAMATWSATTTNTIFPQSCDSFVLNKQGKIVTQMFCATVQSGDGIADVNVNGGEKKTGN